MGALSWLLVAAAIVVTSSMVFLLYRRRRNPTLTLTQKSAHRAALQEIGNELIAKIKLPLGTINPDLPRKGRFGVTIEHFWFHKGLRVKRVERILLTIHLPSDMKSKSELEGLSRDHIQPAIHEHLENQPGINVRLQIFLWSVKADPSTSIIEFQDSRSPLQRRK